jgi:hypothetical protein
MTVAKSLTSKITTSTTASLIYLLILGLILPTIYISHILNLTGLIMVVKG